MKKYVALIAVFLLLCLLCSCEIFYTPDFQCIIDSAGYIDMYIYKGQEYPIFSNNQDNYSFYRLADEKVIGHFPISYLFWTFYEVNNPDFGIVLRDHFMGLDRSAFCFLPHYCLPKDAKMPDIQTVELDKIILADTVGTGYNEISLANMESYSDFESIKELTILNNDEWCNNEDSSTLGDILDFSDTIPREHFDSLNKGVPWEKNEDSDYDYYSWGYIIATLKDYESFFCGPLLVIEYNDRLYVEIKSTTDDSSEYVAVREEYQELFENVLAERSD